jgi:Na+/melibiose symporter-like transporter
LCKGCCEVKLFLERLGLVTLFVIASVLIVLLSTIHWVAVVASVVAVVVMCVGVLSLIFMFIHWLFIEPFRRPKP